MDMGRNHAEGQDLGAFLAGDDPQHPAQEHCGVPSDEGPPVSGSPNEMVVDVVPHVANIARAPMESASSFCEQGRKDASFHAVSLSIA
jgi:hypothetical protein